MNIINRTVKHQGAESNPTISDLQSDSQDCSICDTDDDIDRDTGFICGVCAEKYCSD